MHVDLEARRAAFSVGEFSSFSIGPRDGGAGGAQGIWRAQLGSHWHRELQERTKSEDPLAAFEVAITGALAHRGWVIDLQGRIDQQLAQQAVVREVKSVTRPLPAEEEELRAEYPGYFIQAATYAALLRLRNAPHRAELVFVEAGSGITQTVVLSQQDETLFSNQLESVVQFLVQREEARERLRRLSFRPPFARLRAGQEAAAENLTAAVRRGQSAVLFEAPTGFGKTGILLESALTLLKAGHVERVIYLTGKATGQIQVASTIAQMVTPEPGMAPIGVWQVRNKAEHCINEVFLCTRETCQRLVNQEERWKTSGLGTLIMDPRAGRDMDSLKAAGRAANLCPYEITRSALAFNEVWIGDLNYVFAPNVKGLFDAQPGFEPGATLLVIDEAHNLASRVADAYSCAFSGSDSWHTGEELRRIHAPAKLIQAWENWTRFLDNLPESGGHRAAIEDDAKDLMQRVADLLQAMPVDYALLGSDASQSLWRLSEALRNLTEESLPSLWWSPRQGQLVVTCLDASTIIGRILRSYAGVILSTATPGPLGVFAEALGLAEPKPVAKRAPLDTPGRFGELTKKDTKKLAKLVSRGSELLKEAEAQALSMLTAVRADTPWRRGAYTVAYDLRADTRFQARERSMPVTADTIVRFQESLGVGGKLAVFFPSFAYAEALVKGVAAIPDSPSVALQPRKGDLAAQAAWMASALEQFDILFLVLGSGFAEGVDALGGRVQGAMVVGPALPEVNPVQKARLEELSALGREGAVERVYRVPGMQKVNQALGRLVRAPGQTAKVLLHCVRFGEGAFQDLLANDYQGGTSISTEGEFAAWLQGNAGR